MVRGAPRPFVSQALLLGHLQSIDVAELAFTQKSALEAYASMTLVEDVAWCQKKNAHLPRR